MCATGFPSGAVFLLYIFCVGLILKQEVDILGNGLTSVKFGFVNNHAYKSDW